MRYYTGVGSRDISEREYNVLAVIAQRFAQMGYTLRSGAADGADQAFQHGACVKNPNLTEIWLPTWNFKKQEVQRNSIFKGSNYFVPSEEQFSEARQVYLETEIISWYDNMKPYAQKFHGRNYRQVVGHNAVDISSVCVYCAPEKDGKVSGGTRSAVELSRYFDKPTYNIRIKEQAEKLLGLLQLDKGLLEGV